MKHKIKLGNVEVTSGIDALERMAILLWGPASVGKTTLSATAPGVKLWLSFGDNEHVSVAHRKDVLVANLSKLSLDELFNQLEGNDPFGLDKILAENTEIETVVCDSATALTYNCLLRAIDQKIGASRKESFTPTIMAPGLSAYGARNGLLIKALTGLLRITSKHGVHIIITAHEADPDMRVIDGKEVIDKISIMLGGQIVNNVTFRLSEIWYLSQSDLGRKERRLAVRPTRLRRPMKSRIYETVGDPEFTLNYDANKPDKGQMTIASIFAQWKANGGNKIPIPKGKV